MINRQMKMMLMIPALVCSVQVSAMQIPQTPTGLDALNTEERALDFKLTHHEFTLNQRTIQPEAAVATVAEVVTIFRKRHAYLHSLFADCEQAAIRGELVDLNRWYDKAQYLLLEEMKSIKRFLWMFKDYNYEHMSAHFWDEQSRSTIRRAFIDLLNLFEEMHTLRISACRILIERGVGSELLSQVLVDTSIERNFQDYARALNVEVDASSWFKRMRNNDI